MSQKNPLDRQHLKEVLHRDDLTENILKARDWARAHLETVLIGVLLLAALIFGGIYMVNASRQKELAASKLLAEAQQVFQQAGSLQGSAAADAFGQAYAKFQGVAGAYGGSTSAYPAKLGMANSLLAQGKAADAEREYAPLDSSDAEDPIAALAAFGKARALEAQGKAGDAKSAFLAVASRYPKSAVEAQALAEAKRLEAKK